MKPPFQTNKFLLDELFIQGEIRLARGAIFQHEATPVKQKSSFDRVEGMLLGLAIGDALGAVSEGMLPSTRRSIFGEIEDFPPNPRAAGRAVGTPTDDSQLAFYTIESLLSTGALEPAALGQKFLNEPIFGLGGTVYRALANLERGEPWYRAGPRSAGNGALMRIAPVLLPHLRAGGAALWADVALAAMLTHNDPASTAACIAFIAMLWDLLTFDQVPDTSWWVERYFTIADPLENAHDYRPRNPWSPGHEGRLCDYVKDQVPKALGRGLTVFDACDRWGSGAYLLETMPSVLFILSRHAQDPEQAIQRAVNDTVDNDTHAAIVGAAVGALHGASSLPRRWQLGLLGQLRGGDDGQVLQLIDQVKQCWWLES